MELFFSGLSDVGNVRRNNEDYLFGSKLKEDEYLFIVADGMGGHNAGEIASRKAVTAFVQRMEKGNLYTDTPPEGVSMGIGSFFRRIMLEVNDILLEEGSRYVDRNGMGTTMSVLFIKGDRGYLAHVGDSRIYRYTPGPDNGNLEQLTEDHSFVGRLLKDGFISEEDARNHPKRNVLYQSIGVKKDLDVQVKEDFPILPGEKYLLCSDGLFGVVSNRELCEHLADGLTARVTQQLIKRAKANGGPDNITVLVVSTEKEEIPQEDELKKLTDTVKIIDSPVIVKQKKRKKITLFFLLTLLVILLAIIVYLTINELNRRPPVIPGPESTTTSPEKSVIPLLKGNETYFK